MRSELQALLLLVASNFGCAPHVTIADDTSGGGSGAQAGSSGSGSGNGTGGSSAPSGGSSSGGSNGEGASGGTGGAAGSGNAPSDDCRRALPELDCDWRAALGAPGIQGYCYKGGCHNASTTAGALNLTADDFLAARLLNVPAKYDIRCAGGVVCDPAAPTCDKCSACPPGEVLLSARAPGEGRIFDTMVPFVPGVTLSTLPLGCGDAMPSYNTVGTVNYTQAHKDCLIRFFTELAKTPGTWPCE